MVVSLVEGSEPAYPEHPRRGVRASEEPGQLGPRCGGCNALASAHLTEPTRLSVSVSGYVLGSTDELSTNQPTVRLVTD